MRLAAAAALIAATLAPAAASAEEVRYSSVPIYTFVQLSVNTATITPAEFKAQTEAIRSCGDARKLGRSLNARINNGEAVRATSMPPQIRPFLHETPTGRATPVLVENGSAMHVVVVCHRT